MKSIVKRLFIGLIALSAAFCFSACSQGESFTYWNIVKKKTSADTLQYYATIYIEEVSSSKTIDEVWVNVSGFGDEKVTVDISFASSSSASSFYNKQSVDIDRSLASDADGWIRLSDGLNVSRSYCFLTVSDSVHLNEIVFIASDDSRFSGHVVEAGERSSSKPSNKREYDLNEASSAENGSPESRLADKIMDEQDRFDHESATILYEKAAAKNDKNADRTSAK